MDNIKVLILNAPNNPTGIVYDKKTLKRLAQLAQKHDWIIIEDAVYNRIYDYTPCLSIASFCPDRTVVLHSASKNFCMPGLRIGWLIGPEGLISEIAKMHRNMNSCPNSFFQKVLADFIPMSVEFFEELREEMRIRRLMVKKIMNEVNWEYIEVENGIYIMVKVPQMTNSVKFVEKLIKEAKISAMPGKYFGGHEEYLRICYGALDQKQILEFGSRLKKVVN